MRSPETIASDQRVTKLAVRFAEAIGRSEDEITYAEIIEALASATKTWAHHLRRSELEDDQPMAATAKPKED